MAPDPTTPGGDAATGTADRTAERGEDRRARLVEVVRRQGVVRVADLADHLGAAAVTVRRDVAALAAEGVLVRSHGTVALPAAPGEPAARPAPAPVRPVGMLVPSLDYYWPGVVLGAQEAARARGLRLVLRGSSYGASDERPLLERLVAGGELAGLLAAPATASPHAADTVRWLASTGLPVVLVERTPPSRAGRLESVVTDHPDGAAAAVEHLLDLGHRRIGVVTHHRSPTAPQVREGWARALRAAGVATTDLVDTSVPGAAEPGGDAALDAVLGAVRSSGTTAVLVHADAEAIALVQRCEHHGVRVPEDLSVVAYDDEVAPLCSPALTAVRPPRRSIGRAAVDLLAARLADPGRPPHRVVVTSTLHVRDSTGPVPG